VVTILPNRSSGGVVFRRERSDRAGAGRLEACRHRRRRAVAAGENA